MTSSMKTHYLKNVWSKTFSTKLELKEKVNFEFLTKRVHFNKLTPSLEVIPILEIIFEIIVDDNMSQFTNPNSEATQVPKINSEVDCNMSWIYYTYYPNKGMGIQKSLTIAYILQVLFRFIRMSALRSFLLL